MKAVVFERVGEAPALREIADPFAGAGDVVVDVVAASVLAYAGEVFSGKRPMLFETPFVPGTGAIGRVRMLGTESTALRVGEWVYCDPTVRSRDAHGQGDIYLQGLTANGPAAMPLLRRYRHGSWAEQLLLPLENVISLGVIDERSAAQWLAMGSMLVPYGGFLSVGLQAGETVAVNGATGNFGSAAVAVALAMGAARVVAVGRNAAALDALRARFGPAVRTAAMLGDEAADTAAIHTAAAQPVDVVLDILPPAATAAQVRAAIRAVRPGGRVSLMGGVADDVALPYAWLMRNNISVRGQWMYPRDAIARLVTLVHAGAIDLGHYDFTGFPLAAVQDAIAHAASTSGPFAKTVLMAR